MAKPTGLATGDKTRYMREYMARRRGSKAYKSMAEDAAVLVALAAGEVTEVCAARVLGLDIVAVRERLQAMTALGVERVRKSLEARMDALRVQLAKASK